MTGIEGEFTKMSFSIMDGRERAASQGKVNGGIREKKRFLDMLGDAHGQLS